jgi:hypothetical protein
MASWKCLYEQLSEEKKGKPGSRWIDMRSAIAMAAPVEALIDTKRFYGVLNSVCPGDMA